MRTLQDILKRWDRKDGRTRSFLQALRERKRKLQKKKKTGIVGSYRQ